MDEFTLIDLYSQYEHVLEYTKGMSTEEILSWLGLYGAVTKVTSPYDDNLYSFRSNFDKITGFRLHEDGKIIVFH